MKEKWQKSAKNLNFDCVHFWWIFLKTSSHRSLKFKKTRWSVQSWEVLLTLYQKRRNAWFPLYIFCGFYVMSPFKKNWFWGFFINVPKIFLDFVSTHFNVVIYVCRDVRAKLMNPSTFWLEDSVKPREYSLVYLAILSWVD